MRAIYWKPWIEETKQLINQSARWLFAALVLTLLVLSNIAAVFVILTQLKALISK